MNCIVVDDNKLARAAMVQLISQLDFLKLKKECESPVDAINYLNKQPIDLLFLDVEMPEMSGIEMVRNLSRRPIIILITAKENYAVEAFELNVADYIVKPVTLPRFLTAVNRAKELFEGRTEKIEVAGKEMDYIFVRNNSVITKILINDIYYVQALGDYVNIFTRDKRFTIHMTLSGIEQKLPAEKFYRLHRSYIVALDHIDNIEEGTAFVNKHPIPIGEQYKQVLLKKINFI
jgi:DNA-binding LytR/AlgR family response regulator